MRAGTVGHFLWIGSDSWGAKIHPVFQTSLFYPIVFITIFFVLNNIFLNLNENLRLVEPI